MVGVVAVPLLDDRLGADVDGVVGVLVVGGLLVRLDTSQLSLMSSL